MTVTRSKTGATPRKTEFPGFVETPPTRSRSTRKLRQSVLSESSDEASSDLSPAADANRPSMAVEVQIPAKSTSGASHGTANGHKSTPSKSKKTVDGWSAGADPKVDSSGHYEFGGTAGVSAMMIGFPLLMYYMWIGATYYDGKFPVPTADQTFVEFLQHLGHLAYTGAYPSLRAWTIYWTFLLVEAAFYLYMPGVMVKGKPLAHEGGKQLPYYCSGVWSLYTTLALAGILHYTSLFPLYTLIDLFGPLMSVAIISGFLISIAAYASAIYRGATHRISGAPVYDFFMGAELNPRLFGILDLKMFFEVRLPWYILLLITLGAATRQYSQFGWVSPEISFLVLAHFLYANACSKGEESIVPSWDIYYEKWGFMLIFWNAAGVPLSYCHSTIYLANHAPSVYRWPTPFLIALFTSYLFVYWVWDTCNSQKNRFRAASSGTLIQRATFPQLPWQTVHNPQSIATASGDPILVDGWYRLARKVHYTCDLYFALTWGLVTGFESPFPWFYPLFFAAMISHRAYRDIQRCRAKYGKAWLEYERRVPYLFIPYVF